MCVQQGVQIAFVAFVRDFEGNRGHSHCHGVCVSVRDFDSNTGTSRYHLSLCDCA